MRITTAPKNHFVVWRYRTNLHPLQDTVAVERAAYTALLPDRTVLIPESAANGALPPPWATRMYSLRIQRSTKPNDLEDTLYHELAQEAGAIHLPCKGMEYGTRCLCRRTLPDCREWIYFCRYCQAALTKEFPSLWPHSDECARIEAMDIDFRRSHRARV